MSFDDMLTTAAEVPTRTRREPAQRRALIGGTPQVSLLPTEVRDAARGRSTRLLLVGGVAVAVAIAAAMTVAGSLANTQSQTRLQTAQAQTPLLMQRIAKFNDVQALQQRVALGQAAKKVGASTEIDWHQQLLDIQQDMPYGYTITDITADSASVIADYPQGTSPLEKPRVATVTLTVDAQDITLLPAWLRKLRAIPAFADETSSFQAGDSTKGGYVVDVVVHLSPKAEVRQSSEGSAQ